MSNNIEIHNVKKSKIDTIDFSNISFGRVFSDHIFYMEYEAGKWGQPIIKPYESFQLSPSSAVLHYSQTVFEGLKAYSYPDNKVSIFRPEMNVCRLNKSVVRMCMPTVDKDILYNGIKELVRLDRQWVPSEVGSSLYIRPFLFANDDYIGVRPSESYILCVFTCPVGAYYGKPVRVKIETEYIRAASGGTGNVKFGGNYAGSLMPAQLANKQGYDQIIWTDAQTHTYIEEAGTMNIMFVKDGVLVTPATSGTILEGITRDSIITVAKNMSIKVEERPVLVTELIEGIQSKSITEVFGVGTAATIAPISCVGYKNENNDIPLLDNGISAKLYDKLEGIKRGKYSDSFDWLTLV